MAKLLIVVSMAMALSACGGKKPVATNPDPDTGPVKDPNANVNDPTMVSADTMDEITRLFVRKGNAVSRCLSFAVDNKELPKNSHGKVTLGVTISRTGKADEVKVIKATLESKSLNECVVNRVKEIQFPQVPKPYETTYTYAFEAS
jgi:hypothetical protein